MPELKVIIGSITFAVLFFIGVSAKDHYKTKWQNEIHAEYAESTRLATIKRNADIERLKIEQAETNRKIVTDYEKQLKTMSNRVTELKSRGVRVPKTICSGVAATAKAESTEGNNEASDFRLPEWLTRNLYEYANRAEEIKLQLDSCQSWIIQNGFYSSAPSSTPSK